MRTGPRGPDAIGHLAQHALTQQAHRRQFARVGYLMHGGNQLSRDLRLEICFDQFVVQLETCLRPMHQAAGAHTERRCLLQRGNGFGFGFLKEIPQTMQ